MNSVCVLVKGLNCGKFDKGFTESSVVEGLNCGMVKGMSQSALKEGFKGLSKSSLVEGLNCGLVKRMS